MIHEHDRLIERYMDGEMSHAEEQEFLKRTEHDPELHRLLKAERAIMGGTQKERLAMSAASSEPGAALLAKLAATPAATAVQTAAVGVSMFSNTLVQWAIAAVGTLGIVVGAFVIAPMVSSRNESVNEPAPSVSTVPPAVQEPVKPEIPAPQPAEQPSAPAGVQNAQPQPSSDMKSASGEQGQQRVKQRATPTERKPAADKAFPLDEGDDNHPVFDNDTVKIRTRMGTE